jgi:hypothetical protein
MLDYDFAEVEMIGFIVLVVSLLMLIGTLWVSDSFAQQYDLDTMSFDDLPAHDEGEVILIVNGISDYNGNDTWFGQVVGSDSVSDSYNGSGMDVIVGNTYTFGAVFVIIFIII